MDHELEQAQIKQEIGPCLRAPSLCVVPLRATGGGAVCSDGCGALRQLQLLRSSHPSALQGGIVKGPSFLRVYSLEGPLSPIGEGGAEQASRSWPGPDSQQEWGPVRVQVTSTPPGCPPRQRQGGQRRVV